MSERSDITGATKVQRNFLLYTFFLLGLLLGANWSVLAVTGQLLWQSDDMAHGFVAPFVTVFIVWMKWGPVRAGLRAGNGMVVGAILLTFFALASVFFAYGGSTTFARLAFLGSLASLAVFLGGWNLLRLLSFPLGLLLFCFPIPNVLYGEITQPLQLMAAALSENVFELLGYVTFREGNVIHLPHQVLSVAEACSGIRSLITLLFATTVYSYFFENRVWVRCLLILTSVPAAILMNMMRITMSGVLSKYDRSWVNGSYHDGLGWAALVLGFVLVLLVHKLLERFAAPRVVAASSGSIAKAAYQIPSGFKIAAATVVVVLGAQTYLLNAWSRREFIPQIAPLATIPSSYPQWAFVSDPPVDDAALAMLSPDDHLNRVYRSEKDSTPVSLFMAYYATQHRAKNAHDPKVCLPGSGWNPVKSSEEPISMGGQMILVNQYVVRKEGRENLVVYWFQLHDGTATKEQGLRWKRIFSSNLSNRSDMALVRFVTNVANGNVDEAWKRVSALAAVTYPNIVSRFPATAAN